MYDGIKKARHMIARDGWAVLVTVTATQGSIPRDAGTKMLVSAKSITGTIGGGALEHMAIRQARLMGQSQQDSIKEMDIPLGPKTGQCCGGRVFLRLEKLQPELIGDLVDEVRTPLYLFGAGHVGKAIISRMDNLPFRIFWIDSRGDEFPDSIPANVEKFLSGSSLKYADDAAENSAFLVMTHSHQIDYAITASILKRRDSAYCGLIGSKTKRNRFLKRFMEEEGLSKMDCARLTCPVGVTSLVGKEPEIVAISVIAQLLEIFS